MANGKMFDLTGQTAVVTGGSGALGTAMSRGLADAGARVVIIGRRIEMCERAANDIVKAGGKAEPFACDVLDKGALAAAAERIGVVDILVNGAGGNQSRAMTSPTQPFFDLADDAMRTVFDTNFTGTVFASQAFGRGMAQRGQGVIVNISSMAAIRPLTRGIAYGAAKAAIDNFTQWLAVHMAQEYSPRIRVNAIAPGFFLGEQNRWLLVDKDTGNLTARGQTIVNHTPMRRFGETQELIGTLVWLTSPASAFVTGVVVPVDGGFSAFGGV